MNRLWIGDADRFGFWWVIMDWFWDSFAFYKGIFG